MKRILSFLLIIISFFAEAQNVGDTITIKTFNYSQTYGVNQWSPGIRDSVIDFTVLPNVSFERVLMSYNMRCKNAKVSNGNNRDRGCGEWDASCNTYFHDSSRIDSVRSTHPNFIVSGFSGNEFDYTSKPLYDYYRFKFKNVIVNQVNSEVEHNLFSSNSEKNTAIDGSQYSGKIMLMYTALELSNAGFTAGDIDGIKLSALNSGKVNFFRLRIKGVVYDTLNYKNAEIDQFTQVYFGNYEFAQGSNRVQFIRPFTWNGTDNLIFEFTYTNSEPTETIELEASTSNLAMSTYNNYSVDVSANGHFDVPAASLSTISDEITVSMWVYGDDQLPTGTTILYGEGANGERDLNIHLPWSNSSVFWDCGADGSNYDRINKTASALDIKGRWNHWAFTKNAATGDMKIYLNGSLWHSGTGKTKSIDISRLVIGKNAAYGNNYKGKIDELQIWDKELDEQTIANWMNIEVDQSHPFYNNLVAYYQFDAGSGFNEVSAANTSDTAKANENITWQHVRGIDLNRFFKLNSTRPNITLLQGDYDTSVVAEIVLDSALILPRTVAAYEIESYPGKLQSDKVLNVKNSLLWPAVPQIIYNGTTTEKYDEIPVAKEGTLEISSLEYYNRWPAKFEIMSFVTPYGIGLDLGKNGKTWTFDVTDYMPIFTGKKRMTIERGGQWMEDMDIQFHFIVGTPERDVLDIQQIWRPESRGYAAINNNTFFPPRKLELLPNGEYFEVRSVITGHGQEGEFIPRNHHLYVDGDKKFTWQVWKECAENPIYPQGGTWVYDRAGWCPGAPSDMHRSQITNLVTAGNQVELDYDVDVAEGTSNYIANHQLVTYGKVNHALDARLMDVKTPSKKVEYSRFNSICYSPTIIIQNTGSTELTSATIEYWINDASEPMVHEWKGKLGFLESEEVSLNTLPNFWKEADENVNIFHAEITKANGTDDEYTTNNIFHSEFNLPAVLPNAFLINFRTNNFPLENKIEVVDYQGNVVYSRENMTANTTYMDTLKLGLGCYTLNVYDYDDDGLSWWANNDGSGFLTLREINRRVINNFNPDFGDNIHYNFTVDYPLSFNDVTKTSGLQVYPNPAKDFINIDFEGMSDRALIQIFDVNGKLILNENANLHEGFISKQFILKDLNKGIYIVNVLDGDKVYTQMFNKN